MSSSALISASTLKEKTKSQSNVVLLDATYGQIVDYTIDGAIHFDIDVIADQTNPLPHMIPSAEMFQHHAQQMGINSDSEIIVFDKNGFWMAAARVWWMFRLFGHDNVKILDGGLQSWSEELTPYSLSKPTASGNFKVNFQSHLYKKYDDICASDGSFLLIDARPAQAYDSGHMDHAISIPLPMLIAPNCCLKSVSDLKDTLKPALESNLPLATTCGSGVTACALALGLYECGHPNVAVYDGSWLEWASYNN